MLSQITVIPISLDAAIAAPASGLPHGDQFDRVITAMAKTHGQKLITKDGNITDPALFA